MTDESLYTWCFRQIMNIYPIFFFTGGRVLHLASNWQRVVIQLKLGFRTRNYVGTIFGGSQFSALDPFHVVLLINRLGKDFIVWDKSASIVFKKPAKGRLKAEIEFSNDEVDEILKQVKLKGKYEFEKTVPWIDQNGDTVSILQKTLYVATKEYYQERKKN